MPFRYSQASTFSRHLPVLARHSGQPTHRHRRLYVLSPAPIIAVSPISMRGSRSKGGVGALFQVQVLDLLTRSLLHCSSDLELWVLIIAKGAGGR